MMTHRRISGGGIWEGQIGYSRAVLAGNTLEISGTTSATTEGVVLGKDNAFEQTRAIMDKFSQIMSDAGFSWKDVVRTRIYLTNIEDWEDVARAHVAYCGEHPPACTLLQVQKFIHPDMLVEIELTAVRNV
jgi:enamine deaminase RidA (YjgF/YER057c/UK114 family)